MKITFKLTLIIFILISCSRLDTRLFRTDYYNLHEGLANQESKTKLKFKGVVTGEILEMKWDRFDLFPPGYTYYSSDNPEKNSVYATDSSYDNYRNTYNYDEVLLYGLYSDFGMIQFEITTNCIRIPKGASKEEQEAIISSHRKDFDSEDIDRRYNSLPVTFTPIRALDSPIHAELNTSNRFDELIYDETYGIYAIYCDNEWFELKLD